MKKHSIKLGALFVILVFTLGIMAGCGKSAEKPAEAAKPIVLKLANVSPVGDPRDEAAKKFAAAVDNKTGGKVKVEVFSGGTLGAWRETIEGLKPGIVQVVLESVGTLEPYAALAAIDAVPFLYQDDNHFKKVWYGDLGKQLLNDIGNKGSFTMIGPMHRGARYVTSKKKIETAADLKGLKIRVPQIKIYMKTWEKLGATPTPMAFTEVYTGLQQGTVEAQENPLTLSYSSAFYEVCPFLIKTKHVYSLDVFIFDKSYLASLPADIQKAITEAANEAAQWRTDYELANEANYIKKFEEKNVTVIEPDIKTFTAKLEGFLEDFPELKDYVAKIQALQ